MFTERVRFCTGPEVNFDFFTSHHNCVIFDDHYPLREFHRKYLISMGKKLALITNGLSGYPKTRPDSDPIKKKDGPDDPYSVKFFRRLAERPDKKLSLHRPS